MIAQCAVVFNKIISEVLSNVFGNLLRFKSGVLKIFYLKNYLLLKQECNYFEENEILQ